MFGAKSVRILGLFFSLVLMGCGSLGTKIQAKKFFIDKLWVRNTLTKDHYGFRHPHRMTPLVHKGFIVQGNGLDAMSSYNLKTGNLNWRKKIKGGVEGGAVISSGKLFFGAGDGYFYALQVHSGQVLWKFPVNADVLSKPTVNKKLVFFIAGNNRVYALNMSTGKVVWSYSRQQTTTISIRGGSQPTLHQDKLILGFSDGAVSSLNAKTGKIDWEMQLNKNRRFRDIDANPVVHNGKIYVASFDEGLYCLDVSDGKIIWKHDEGGFSAVTISNEFLYYATTNGYVLALDKTNGKVIWRYALKKGLATQPKFFRGLIVFGEYEGDFKVLESLSGKAVGHYSTGRGIMSSPYIDIPTGNTYFISVNANLFALRMQWRTNKETWPWEK